MVSYSPIPSFRSFKPAFLTRYTRDVVDKPLPEASAPSVSADGAVITVLQKKLLISRRFRLCCIHPARSESVDGRYSPVVRDEQETPFPRLKSLPKGTYHGCIQMRGHFIENTIVSATQGYRTLGAYSKLGGS
jgi:hypothetical protein